MERWLILLQRLGKVVPLALAVLLVVAVAGFGVYQWQQPVLLKLLEKDPYRHEQMVDEALHLHWIQGQIKIR